MPPRHIRHLAAAAGFSSIRILADVYHYPLLFTRKEPGHRLLRKLPLPGSLIQDLRVINHERKKKRAGMVVMVK
jgi:hypothetical protein